MYKVSNEVARIVEELDFNDLVKATANRLLYSAEDPDDAQPLSPTAKIFLRAAAKFIKENDNA